MERTISTITVLPVTKSEKENYIQNVVNEFNNLEYYEQNELVQRIKIACEVFEGILKNPDVKGAIVSNMENNRLTTQLGTIERTERKSWKYDCQLHTELKEKITKLETIMKTIEAPIADADTGEIIEPANYTTTEVITFRFAK